MQTVPAKTIVTRTKSTAWFGTEYNMNLYRGCCHGCIYCDSRSDCYRIDDFDQVRAKENALQIIRDELRRRVRTGVVGTGAMSDPYNPFEQKQQLTRHALELLSAYGFGVAIATKSTLVTRDTDILREIGTQAPALVKITITVADDALAKQIEPHAPPSSERFAAMRRLSEAGIYCGVLLMPVLPWLTDSPENIRAVVEQAAENGARFVYPGLGVTLRDGQREYFYSRLGAIDPALPEQYRKRYGSRYSCAPPGAKALWQVFRACCDRHGLLYDMRDIIRSYRLGYDDTQTTLF